MTTKKKRNLRTYNQRSILAVSSEIKSILRNLENFVCAEELPDEGIEDEKTVEKKVKTLICLMKIYRCHLGKKSASQAE